MISVPDTDSNLVQPPQKGTKFAKIQFETKCGKLAMSKSSVENRLEICGESGIICNRSHEKSNRTNSLPHSRRIFLRVGSRAEPRCHRRHAVARGDDESQRRGHPRGPTGGIQR